MKHSNGKVRKECKEYKPKHMKVNDEVKWYDQQRENKPFEQ